MSEHSAGRMRSSVWTSLSPEEEARGETLQLLFENNERGLRLMAQSIESAEEPGAPGLEFRRQLHDVWRNTDAATMTRVACFPTLLLDIRGWDAPANPGESRGFFPDLCAVSLMRSTLTLAWHVCRTERKTAGILFGLPARSVNLLGQLRPHDLERISLTRAHCLRPRWSTLPSMWIGLLMAARGNDLQALEEFKLHALQQMIGELLSDHAER